MQMAFSLSRGCFHSSFQVWIGAVYSLLTTLSLHWRLENRFPSLAAESNLDGTLRRFSGRIRAVAVPASETIISSFETHGCGSKNHSSALSFGMIWRKGKQWSWSMEVKCSSLIYADMDFAILTVGDNIAILAASHTISALLRLPNPFEDQCW